MKTGLHCRAPRYQPCHEGSFQHMSLIQNRIPYGIVATEESVHMCRHRCVCVCIIHIKHVYIGTYIHVIIYCAAISGF